MLCWIARLAPAAPFGRLTNCHVGCICAQLAASSSPSVMTSRLPEDGHRCCPKNEPSCLPSTWKFLFFVSYFCRNDFARAIAIVES